MNIKGRRSVSALLSLALLLPVGAGALPARAEATAECLAYATGEVCGNEAIEVLRIGAVTDGAIDGEGAVIGSRIWELLAGSEEQAAKADERPVLLVGGGVFGTRIKEARISISSSDDGSPLKEGDKIISINGKDIRAISDVKEILKGSDGSALEIVCSRGGRSVSIKCTPKMVGGEYRLGAVLREGAAGIGTVTYIDPKTHEFGGLGHAICDADSGKIIEMTGGTVTDVILGGVVKGECGKPGELSGILTDRPMGEIWANTDSGVFGRLDVLPRGTGTALYPIAYRGEVKSGEATVISTLKNGATMKYKVELSEIKASATGTKCFKIKVTDPALLAISGGIVRGMSGSPIIQDGKLVGAVTHVLVDDPSSGYGIFIENMLSAAEKTIPKAA